MQWYDRDSAAVFSDVEFVKCRFESCGFSVTRDPNLRSTLRRARFTRCEQRGSTLKAAILEDVVVDDLRTNGPSRRGAPYLNTLFCAEELADSW